jgi:hypothetical protein
LLHGSDCLLFVFLDLEESLIDIIFNPAKELLSGVAHGINIIEFREHTVLEFFVGWGWYALASGVGVIEDCCLGVGKGITGDKKYFLYYLGGGLRFFVNLLVFACHFLSSLFALVTDSVA